MNRPTPVGTMPDEASNAQPGADTVLTDESWWPQGKYWRASTPFEPTLWASNAKLCNCPEHGKNSWPAEHAIFHIPNCAKRCPYCPWKTNRNGKGDNPASNLRRHIRQYYIIDEADIFPCLQVYRSCFDPSMGVTYAN